MKRYQVQYGEIVGFKAPYVLWDTKDRIVRWSSESKGEIIALAQRWNGFTPVDGNEQTYGRQSSEVEGKD
jgi:hypothetical protein